MRDARLKNKGVKKRKDKEGNGARGEWLALLTVFLIIVLGVKFFEFAGRAYPLKSMEVKCRSEIDFSQFQALKKLSIGMNMLRIDPKDIAEELLRHPKIKDVRIQRHFSEGKLVITAGERVPFLRVMQEGSDIYSDVDEGGSVIGQSRNFSLDIPFVTTARLSDNEQKALLPKAAGFVKAAGAEGISVKEISELDMRDPQNLILVTGDGIEFHLGTGDFPGKLRKVKKLMGQIKTWGMSIEYVDLRFGGEAVLKPKASS